MLTQLKKATLQFLVHGHLFLTYELDLCQVDQVNKLCFNNCAQMHHFLGLPGGAAAGISDSKLPDMQAGWEQGISNIKLSGLNLVYESVGMHASLLGFSLESLILGNDIIGQVQRCVRD